MRRSLPVTLSLAAVVATGSAMVAAPAAFAGDGSASATVIPLSGTPGGYQLSLSGVGTGVVIDYTVAPTGQIGSASPDAASTTMPASVSVTGDGVAVTLADGTVVSVDLGDTKTTVSGVDVAPPGTATGSTGSTGSTGNTDSQSQEPPTTAESPSPEPTDSASETPEPSAAPSESPDAPEATDTTTESPSPQESAQPAGDGSSGSTGSNDASQGKQSDSGSASHDGSSDSASGSAGGD